MKVELLTKLINRLMNTGGSFGELFLEDTKEKKYLFINNGLDKINLNYSKGIGFRLALNNDIYYASTNDLDESNLNIMINQLNANINEPIKYANIVLSNLVEYKNIAKIGHNQMTDKEKKQIFNQINNRIRSKDKRVSQVQLMLYEKDSKVTVVNHTGLYKTEVRVLTRLGISISFKDEEKIATIYKAFGINGGDELLNDDYEYIIDEMVKTGLDKLYAKPCVGKNMPVIINNGFGGVIFHEACGHAMEATAVADNLSILCGLLNTKIANEKVTIIDDGTIPNEWGSSYIDDEGSETKKNVLIKNGVLTEYLIDELNSVKMGHPSNGCGRRESYRFAPTSRMSNTYLLPGSDSIDDMIKSVEYGLYAKSMGGGSVSTETGDFNFSVDEAYMIRHGKLAECVKSASLIGNTLEILNNVEMIGNDLKLSSGMCGSQSGNIPVNVGQPTIKVSSILVGGEANED